MKSPTYCNRMWWRLVYLFALLLITNPTFSSAITSFKSHQAVSKPRKNLPKQSPTFDRFLAEADKKPHHAISPFALVINIVADLCPHGMLPLAYGFAQGGPNGLVPALLLLVTFGTMSGYSMSAFASLSQVTGSNTIAEIWGKLISTKSQWIVDVSIFALCYGCCVFYSAFAGDIFGALAQASGFKGIFAKRSTALLTLSSAILLPLCIQEDLSALQVSSFLGVVGILYTVFFHLIRLLDGSYTGASALLNFVAPKLRPSFPTPAFNWFNVNMGTLILGNMMCVSFLAHYNAINYYKELHSTPEKYAKVVAVGFGISTLVFAGMMLLGYKIFGLSCLPLILNNFPRTQDPLATLARIATGVAITFAYPLMFAGLKAAMFNLMDGSSSGDPSKVKVVSNTKKTIAMTTVLASITAIALKCGEEDVSVVLGIVGSVLGCFVAYCLPAILKLTHFRQRKRAGLSYSKGESIFNRFLLGMGTVFGILGVYVTLLTASQHMGHHH